MPDELVVILTAMTPIGELRAAIPLGSVTYDLSWPLVFFLAIIGNLIPVPIVIFGLRAVGARLERRTDVIGRLLRWRTARIEKRWGQRVRRYGFMAVMLIVAIPLPLTGAWTGSLAVYVLRVPLRTGITAIAAGIVVAGVIVTILTQAGVELLRLMG
jgi:uncharacterized membrane protein